MKIGEFELTDREASKLAYAAMLEYWHEDDFRYWTADPAERASRRERWKAIADALGATSRRQEWRRRESR